MMMIAFITINSGLVPLIEGLCAQILYDRFEIISCLRSHLLLESFSEGKICYRKKQLVQDLIPPPSIYLHVCTSYTYTNICISRFSPSGFFGPSRCLIPTPGLTTEYPICAVCVCVCVNTHIHPHTLPPALKNREDTDNIPHSRLATGNLIFSRLAVAASRHCSIFPFSFSSVSQIVCPTFPLFFPFF